MSAWRASEHVVADGTRFHAAVHGRPGRPVVVCVHGLGCSHRYFTPLARHLARDAFVVAPDLPGFGRTPGPRVALDVSGLSSALGGWIRATGRDGATLVANSAGCQIAVDLAVHAPDLIGGLVLSGPTVDRRARGMVRQTLRLLRDVPHERPTLGFVLAGDYARAGPRRIIATARHALNDRIECNLPLVRSPTVVVRGERDPVVSREWALEVSRLVPHGRYVEVPDAGHAVNYSAPEALAQITRPLLDM